MQLVNEASQLRVVRRRLQRKYVVKFIRRQKEAIANPLVLIEDPP